MPCNALRRGVKVQSACRTAEDFLARRSRLAFLDVNAARAALPRVLQLLGREHRWGWLWGRAAREKRCAEEFLQTFEAAAAEMPAAPVATGAHGGAAVPGSEKGLDRVPPDTPQR